MSETDAMICRACGKKERASEGYPCERCGTFICQICELRGVTMCASCAAEVDAAALASKGKSA